MTAEKLSPAEVEALRILAAHDEVREANTTDETVPSIAWQVAHSLYNKWLANEIRTGLYGAHWQIRSKGRQALRDHEAGDQ